MYVQGRHYTNECIFSTYTLFLLVKARHYAYFVRFYATKPARFMNVKERHYAYFFGKVVFALGAHDRSFATYTPIIHV